MLFRAIALSLLALTLSACNLSGTAEKGPFVANSNVSLKQLNSQANPISSDSLSTRTISKTGSYAFKNIRWNGWAELAVSGRYFNEFTASTSTNSIVLKAITNKNITFDTANVHMYSHLAAARIKYRVSNGETLSVAWTGTQLEIKQLFGLEQVSSNINRGVEQLRLSNGSGIFRKDNANLLLFTGSFLAANGDANALDLLTSDFADDGQINGVGLLFYNSVASMGATDGLIGELANNLRNYGVRNPPNSGDLPELPIWVNQNPVDTVAPVITVTGNNPVTVYVGTAYVDEGATAVDEVDGTVNVSAINGSDEIDTSEVSIHTVTYTASDAAGNTSTATRTVNVVNAPDTVAPVITVTGNNPVTVYVGTAYVDEGATAVDDVDGIVTATAINNSHIIDTSAVSIHTVTYSASDAVGNTSTATRTVNVVITPDVEAPVITLIGGNTQILDVHTGGGTAPQYQDPGYSVTDNRDTNVTVNVTGTVNMGVVGSYKLTYSATDAAGNSTSVIRTVNIVDRLAPIVTLNGDASIEIYQGSNYSDQGANAVDAYDGTLSVVVTGSVNTNTLGVYQLVYTATDNANNSASVTRNVTVVVVPDTTAPVITLRGDASLVIQKDATYTDAGATATDNVDGDITANISVNNPVNPSSPATYTVTYTVSDTAGNQATAVTRTVRVNAPPTANAGADVSVSTGETVTLTGTGSDSDGTVSYKWKRGNTVVATTATYTFTAANSESLTFEVEDNDGAVASDTVVVTVSTVNHAPVVEDQYVQFDQDTQNNRIELLSVDPDGDTVTFSHGQPDHGTITDAGNYLQYTPDAGYTGRDRFSFTASDGVASSSARVLITVNSVAQNVAPIAYAQTASFTENSSGNLITLKGTDADGDTLTYAITADPQHGTLSLNGAQVVYAPNENYTGTDSFNFTVNDGALTSNVAKVTIDVMPVTELSNTCHATVTTEAAYIDMFIRDKRADIPWPSNLNNVALTVQDIANVFNAARPNGEYAVGQKFIMPSQAIWNNYSDSEKALYLINAERCVRGIRPYEGISETVVNDTAQYYADYLANNNVFGHNEDGRTPWERLNQLSGVTVNGASGNADFFSRAENLALDSFGSTGAFPTVHEPVAKAIYAWMYNDKEATRQGASAPYTYTYGHREFILAKGLNENSGEQNKEGLIGIATATVQESSGGFNWTKVYTVMNGFDPNDNWIPNTPIKKVDYISPTECLSEFYAPEIRTNSDGVSYLACIPQT